MRWHAKHNSVHLSRRAAHALSFNNEAADPDHSLEDKPTWTLQKRAQMTCGANGTSRCKFNKTNEHDQTIPIVVGVVVPVVFVIVAFIYFYHRYRKRQKAEDKQDNIKHGSLDFGMAEVQARKRAKKGKGGGPEMAQTGLADEKMFRKGRGLSMDMGSPYVMAGDIEPSRGSFNSQTRSAHGGDDPYRAVNSMKSPARSTSNPPTSARMDTSTTYMSHASDEYPQNSTTNLLRGAQKPSRNSPPDTMTTTTTRSSSQTSGPHGNGIEPSHSVSRKPVGMRKPGSTDATSPQDTESQPPVPPPKENNSASNFSLPKNVDRSSISTQGTSGLPQENRNSPPPPLPHRSSSKNPISPPPGADSSSSPLDDYQTYADVLGIAQVSSPPMEQQQDSAGPGSALPTIHEPNNPSGGLAPPEPNQDPRRLSAGMRPLPPVDPADNAEQRANRIRSFYREYFDESNNDHDYDQYDYGEYYEDYGQEYLNGAPIWDPETGQFIMAGSAPYAEPVTRRAMTPPPRAPPRFRAGPGGHRFTSSSGQSHTGGRARAFSAASGRPPMGGRGRPPKRRLPPPGPLNNLPTPHLLKNDNAMFSAIDFAPPPTIRDQALGRAPSPRMDARPFSPTVRAHNPLQSSFQDLTVMPSPHHLRKSGTFTALDFAPPAPKFRESPSGSDNGSIRSGRSGLSAHHAANIHHGAYRLSRLGQNTVGTRDDMMATLKPKWDMTR